MGAIGPDDILTDLEQLEVALREVGLPVSAGAGMQTARAILAQ
jgi:aspartate aminotransferase-like enzyme